MASFSAGDYVVFALILCVNAVVGLYYAIKDRRDKNENTQEYLLGGRNQSVVPVALSLGVTFLSANTMLGTPVDMYYNHTMFMYLTVGLLLATTLASWVFIPFFHRLGYTSTFQYLEERFNYPVRILGVVFVIFDLLLYMAFVLYAPCLALSAVTGLSFEGCMIGMGIVVTFYTTLGGMKTVLWTDTIQSVIMLAGLLAVFIQGIRVVGGWTKVWDIAQERGRVVFDDFSFEPSRRHSFFSVVIGGGIFWLSNYGTSQAQVQRCLATPSISKARVSVMLSAPVIVILFLLCCFNGIIMFAYYADCDPVKFGSIDKKDQLLPLFTLDILGHVDGFPGLFVSSIFAGSLSTLSSGMNAVAAIALEEVKRGIKVQLSEMRAVLFTKVIAIICGVVIIGFAFLVSKLGTLQQASMTVHGILNGPIFGLFILGMFFPWANSVGTFIGFLTSVAFMGWIGIGAYVHEIRNNVPSPTITLGCNWPNGTEPVLSSNTSQPSPGPKTFEGVENLYTLSYLNYTMVGMLTEVVIGLLVSFLTGHTKPDSLDSKYVVPMYYMMKTPSYPEPKEQTDSSVFSCCSRASKRQRSKTSDTNNTNRGYRDSYVEMSVMKTAGSEDDVEVHGVTSKERNGKEKRMR